MLQRILERSNKYFLKVSEHISLTVATIIFLWIKDLKHSILEAIILKQKRSSATEVTYVFMILLECL